jgi:folylpolyglutamate synthase/dihydropteroate synthase
MANDTKKSCNWLWKGIQRSQVSGASTLEMTAAMAFDYFADAGVDLR